MASGQSGDDRFEEALANIDAMKRRLLSILSALSLLVAVATAGSWVRSFWGWDRFSIRRLNPETLTTVKEIEIVLINENPGNGFEMALVKGQGYDSRNLNGEHLGWNLMHFHGTTPYLINGFLGFSFDHRQKAFTAGAVEAYSVALPRYFVLILAAILPAFWTRRFLIERRTVRSNCCVACGYDLRASKGKCPECGAEITTTTS